MSRENIKNVDLAVISQKLISPFTRPHYAPKKSPRRPPRMVDKKTQSQLPRQAQLMQNQATATHNLNSPVESQDELTGRRKSNIAVHVNETSLTSTNYKSFKHAVDKLYSSDRVSGPSGARSCMRGARQPRANHFRELDDASRLRILGSKRGGPEKMRRGYSEHPSEAFVPMELPKASLRHR